MGDIDDTIDQAARQGAIFVEDKFITPFTSTTIHEYRKARVRFSLHNSQIVAMLHGLLCLIAAIILAEFLGVGACNAAAEQTVVRVGSEKEFPPFALVDDNGQATGFSVDLIKAVADAVGLPIVISTGTWDAVWSKMVKGELDVLPVVARLPEREPLVDFSLAHTETFDAFFVRDGNPAIGSIKTARGKTIVVMRSDAAHHELLAQKFQGELVLVDTIPDGLSIVSSGKYDAFLCSKLIGVLAIKKHGIKGLTAGPIIPDYKRLFSFGVKKGANELREKLNQGLLIVKSSGEYNQIYEKWLTYDDPWLKYQKYIFIGSIFTIAIALITAFWSMTIRKLDRRRAVEIKKKNLELEKEITGRKRAEDMLKIQRNQALQYLNIAGVMICALDAEGKIILINIKGQQILGYTQEEIIGKNWFETFLPNQIRTEVWGVFIQLMTGDATPVEYYENKIINKSGEERIIAFHNTIMWDKNEKIVGILFSGDDITDRKHAEEALRDSEERFRVVFERSAFGKVVAAIGGKLLQVNPAFANMLGYSIDDIQRRTYFELTHADDFEKSQECIRCLLANEQINYRMEKRYIHKNGNVVWVDVNTTLLRDSGGTPLYLITGVADITQRKQLEEEQNKLQAQLFKAQKMEAVGVLAGGIAHDFNNILQVISGYTEIMLIDKNEDDPDCVSINAIQKSARRAAYLVRQLLFFSRKMATDKKLLQLNKEIVTVRFILARIIPKMIGIEFNPGNHLWSISADPVQIEQILLNLAANAVDAMPDGGRLIIGTENTIVDGKYTKTNLGAHPGRYVLMTISDTGQGMEKEILEHVFEPFFTTKEIGKGTGLGLASVYGIVKSHGGYITCDTEVGKGTTFKIYFPAIEQTDIDEPDGTVAKPPKGESETILLVDDEYPIREHAKQVLLKFGYQVLTASSGEEALEIYSNKPNQIDLVVMDIGMPGMGGHKCLRELIKVDASVKVLIASGYSINGQLKKTMEAGAAGFVGKPYQLNDLLKKVRSVLDQKD